MLRNRRSRALKEVQSSPYDVELSFISLKEQTVF